MGSTSVCLETHRCLMRSVESGEGLCLNQAKKNSHEEALHAQTVALLCSHAFRLHIEKGFMMLWILCKAFFEIFFYL